MSIHVTVNGNPIHLNRSRLLLTDVDLIRRNEWMRRRKIRLQQARQQAKDLANSVRGKFASQKKSAEKDEEEKRKCHEKKIQTEELDDLQQNFEECLSAVGSAHRFAHIQPECDALVREQEELREAISRARGAVAEERLRAEKSIRKEKESVLAERRQLLKQVEELRAAVVRGQGPTPAPTATRSGADDDRTEEVATPSEKTGGGRSAVRATQTQSEPCPVSSKKTRSPGPSRSVHKPSTIHKQHSKSAVNIMPQRSRCSALSEGEEEQGSSDSDVTWPPRSARVTKEPIPHPRVYDHNSRIVKECPQKAYSVTHIPPSEQPDMCTAIAEEEEAFVRKETLSVAARREKIVRGSKALRKERDAKELQEVLKELKEADRQRKIEQAVSGSYPSELHFRDARRKEVEKMRQAKMNCYLPSYCVERREDQEPIPEIEHGIQLKAHYPQGRTLGQDIPHSSGQVQGKVSAPVSPESNISSSSTTEETLQNLIKRYQKERVKLLGQLREVCSQGEEGEVPQWVPYGHQETESDELGNDRERLIQEGARILQEELPPGFSRSPPRRIIFPDSSERERERQPLTSRPPPPRPIERPSSTPQTERSPVSPPEERPSPDVQITVRPLTSASPQPRSSRSPPFSSQSVEQPPVVLLSMSPELQPQSSDGRISSPGKVQAAVIPASSNGQSVPCQNGEGSPKEKTEKVQENVGLNENIRPDSQNGTEPSKSVNYTSRQTSPIPFSSSSASSGDSSQSGTVESSLTFEGLKVIVKVCEKNSKSTKALPCKRVKEIQQKTNASWDTRLGEQVTSSTSSGSTTYMSPPATLSPNQQALLQSVLNKVQAKNKNPKLHDYIKRLLAMSRDTIEELGVSSSSDVSVHSSVVQPQPLSQRSLHREASCQAEDDNEKKTFEEVMKYTDVANGYASRLQDIAKMIEDLRVFPRQWSRCLEESSGYLSPPPEIADPVGSGLYSCLSHPPPPDRPPMDIPSTLQPHPSHCRSPKTRPPMSLLNGNSRRVAPEAIPHELSTIQEAESRSQTDNRCRPTPTFDPDVSSIRGSPLLMEEGAANSSSGSNLSLIRDKEISSLVESSSDYEDVFRSLGIAWALPTVRKTRECQKRQESSGESSGRGVTTSTPVKKSPGSRSQRPGLSDSDSLTPPSVGLHLPPRPPQD